MSQPEKAGVYQSVPFTDYLSWPAWGSGDLKAYRRGPPARVLFERGRSHEDTEATRIGHAAHCAILQPELFRGSYIEKPEGMKFSTKDGMAWRAAVPDGVCILTHDEAMKVHAIVAAFAAKRPAMKALKHALGVETSVLWRDKETHAWCKGRPDFYGDYLYDLKTCIGPSERMDVTAWRMGWCHQAAWYRAGLQANGVTVKGARLVVIDSAEPHYVYLFEIKENCLDFCALRNAKTIASIDVSDRTSFFAETDDAFLPIEMPPWVEEDEDSMLGAGKIMED